MLSQTKTRERIAGNLQAVMAKKKYSKYKLANDADISYNYIKRLLEAKSDVTVFMLERLAEKLGVSVKTLIG